VLTGEGDAHLAAIRRSFMPEVMWLVFTHVTRVAPAVRKAERAKVREDCPVDPTGVRHRVSIQLHLLTADLVRAFYPFWGDDVTPRRVRETVENRRERSR